MHRQASDVPAPYLDLAGMQAGPDLEPEVRGDLHQGHRAADALGRRGEAGHHAVARVLDMDAVVAAQQALDVHVELVEHVAPLAIAGSGRVPSRIDDVGEEHRGQRPFGRVPAAARQEFLHLIDDALEFTGPGQHVRAREGDEACRGNRFAQVAPVFHQVGEGFGT